VRVEGVIKVQASEMRFEAVILSEISNGKLAKSIFFPSPPKKCLWDIFYGTLSAGI
jgi:hypothetical protein